MKLAIVMVMMVLAGSARADEASSLEALKTAAKCSDKASPWRPWCIAAGFAGGTAAALPKKNLVGMTVELEDGKDFMDALRDHVTFVALAITRDGKVTKVKLTDIKPENDDERTAVAEGVAAAAIVFKGKDKVAKLPKALAEFAKSRTGSYELTNDKKGWKWTGANPSQLRKVGKFWVLIETASSGKGIWATILTDSWTAAK